MVNPQAEQPGLVYNALSAHYDLIWSKRNQFDMKKRLHSYAIFIAVFIGFCSNCVNDVQETNKLEMYGVWKQIDPNINWEYLLIDDTNIIQKFDKKKHYQEWKWNYRQEGSRISIFPDNSDCSITVVAKKNGDTLTITENDRTSQYVSYDTINDTKWSTPEKMDMNIVKDNFCFMLTIHMFTIDSDEDGLYFMEAHLYSSCSAAYKS